jgi:hypothetical protein
MRNTNLWSIIGCISLLLLSFGAQAQNLFVIEGKVKNVKQGVCLNLFQMEGSVIHLGDAVTLLAIERNIPKVIIFLMMP